MSHYSVYLVESMGMPRNHHAIFIKTDDKEEGTIFNITGNALNGFSLEIMETCQSPRLEATFESWAEIGVIASNDLPRTKAICEENPPPGKQYDGLKRIDPAKRLRRCQEWTRQTIEQLREQGVLLYRNLKLQKVHLVETEPQLDLATISKRPSMTLEGCLPVVSTDNDHRAESSAGLDIGSRQHV